MLRTHADSPADVTDLWAVVGDVLAWPGRLPTFDSVVPEDASAPVGTGSRFAVRQPGLPPATYEITEWTPGASFTWAARSTGVTTTASHAVTAVANGGSRVDLTVSWAGILAPIVRVLMARKAARMMESEATTFATIAPERG